MFLAEILKWKREEVRKRSGRPAASFLGETARRNTGIRSFSSALQTPGPSIVAEIKRASPSLGVLAPGLVPEKLAAVYTANGASALSVLTDERFFRGSLADLQAVRAVTNLPILRKDFMIDPYQVLEAKWAGADAVLLIMAALSRAQAAELRACARECGLEVLVEVHQAAEMNALLPWNRRYGINNRDLATFRVSLEVTKELVPMIRAQAGARTFPVISESGIKNRQDVANLWALGIDGFLIGETLVKREDPGKALRELKGEKEEW